MFEKIKNHMSNDPATLFGLGMVKYAPGTMGSLATLPLVFVLDIVLGDKAVFLFIIGVFILGMWSTRRYLATKTTDHDPSEVIIDEVAGQSLALFLLPPSLELYAIAFIAFRFFDIIKPWPVSWADQNLKGETGVMVDDMLAGMYAWIIVQFYFFFIF